MAKVRLILVEDLKVLTPEGFINRWERELALFDHQKGRYPTQKDAWLRVERVYHSIVGCDRYTSFGAFREAVMRHRRKYWSCNKNA